MKPSMRAKLDHLDTRLAELNSLLTSEEATKDMDAYRKLTREHADIALVVEPNVNAEAVRALIQEAAGQLLESVHLFDVYEGAQIGEGKKSLAYSLEFRAADRTLTDPEVLAVRDDVIAACAEKFGASIR